MVTTRECSFGRSGCIRTQPRPFKTATLNSIPRILRVNNFVKEFLVEILYDSKMRLYVPIAMRCIPIVCAKVEEAII